MSGEGLQIGPDTVDLGGERIQVASVVDHVRGLFPPLLTRDLAVDARPRIGLVHAALVHEPLDGDIRIDVDHDRRRKVLAGILAEQREVEHYHPIGLSMGVDLALDLVLHRRVDDAVEIGESLLVVEDDLRHGGPVERTVGTDDVVAEALGHPVEHRAAGGLQIAGDAVGIDDDGTAIGEHRRHGRLAGADAPGEPDEDHSAGRSVVSVSAAAASVTASAVASAVASAAASAGASAAASAGASAGVSAVSL